jgi:predicted CoA-substrate-specific enzyme activase
MIGYVCKYTPEAIFEAFEENGHRLEPSVKNFDYSDSLFHPNMCSYSRAVLQNSKDDNCKKFVFVNCCDSMRRLEDVFKERLNTDFVHMVDLPRKNNSCSREFYANELLKLIAALEKQTGKKFNVKLFKESLAKSKAAFNAPDIVIMGARIKSSLLRSIQKMTNLVVQNQTCTGQEIAFENIPETENVEELIRWYASELLSQTSCMRMENIYSRRKIYENPKLKGIIYHGIKFCDFYALEYLDLKNKLNIPILKIETDFTDQSEGQIKTRVEAFLESMGNVKDSVKPKEEKKNIGEKFYVAGIDSGSTSTNVVIMDENKKIVASSIVRTGPKCSIGAEEALRVALEESGLKREDISYMVATGYGRVSIDFGDEDITEITCHAKGAHFLNPNIRTIIDIGGQDSKVIKIDEEGNVKDFVMNDKCAAGTGRFLEMMAKGLELSIEEMSEKGLKWDEEITISSMCSVFAESEVISLVAENKEIPDIIHGLNVAIASRIAALLNRVGKNPGYMMTGGVAKNKGVLKAIEAKIGSEIYVWDEPQICGAIGAALLAYDKVI